jgi:hypothetical protein
MKYLKIRLFLTGFILLTALTGLHLQAQGYLHRSGKYIYDGSENEVILRGIGTGNWMIQEGYMMQTSSVAGTMHEFKAKLQGSIGTEKTDSFYTVWLDSHFREIDADSMKSWGFNSVRVAMHYKWFTPPIDDEPVPGQITWIDRGFIMIDSLLEWCGKNEMYLILDLHGAPGGQGKDANISDYDPSKPSLWESKANKDKTIALWRKLAERYSNEPWIGGYDLINETNWTFAAGDTQLKTLFVNITNAIREVDQNHIIFIEGNWFANDYTGLTPPWDNNMAYSFHKYWSDNTLGSIDFATKIRNTHNVPIWLGETGENSNPWFTSLITLCEKNRIGWSWWPVKKPGINSPLNVIVNSDYTKLVNSWSGGTKPTADQAFSAVLQFAMNHRMENCIVQKDVLDAMFRQTKTTETIPYQLYNTGDPIFAVNYNLGRNGYAYFDNDTVNIGGSQTVWNQGWSYRNDGVDIESCTDSDSSVKYNVGWTGDGEWMEYTVNVDSTAAYTLSIRSASGSVGSKVHLETNGVALTPVLTVPGTGGWQTWKTSEFTGVILTKGSHKIRFIFDKGGSNLNYFKLSSPVALEDVPFTYVYSESSDDGAKIFLNLNKPVTSPIGNVSITDFSVSISNIPLQISSVGLDTNPNIIVITLSDTLFYGGAIKISYTGSSIASSTQSLVQFSNTAVVNMLPLRFTLPIRIQAEDFSKNNGMVSETCDDGGVGTGIDMGWANPGDYLDYRVYVPQSKYYLFNFRVASNVSGTQLIIRKGDGNSFSTIDTLIIPSTGGWQIWKTMPLTFYLPEGRYTLRLYVRQGEFNFNWFQAASASGVAVSPEKSSGFYVYPNPASDFVMVELPEASIGKTEITLYDALGRTVRDLQSSELTRFRIETKGLSKGMYYVGIRNENIRIFTSRLIIL